MERPRVSLVTLNHNGRELLSPFLASVAAQTWPAAALEVIVVDNGSSDGSVELVEQQYPSVTLIRNERNEGFARANNQAAAAASGRYLALLNNDMRLEPDWVERMVTRLEEAPPDVVCAGSLILSWDGARVDFGGGSIAFNGIGYQTHADAPVAELPGDAFPHEIPFACGGAMLVERTVFLESGGFDEDFFAYVEDVDFGWRLWLLGYRVVFCRDAVAYHHHNATSNQFERHRKGVLIERNSLYAVIKNYDDDSLGRVLAPTLLLLVKRAALRAGVRRGDFSFVRPAAQQPATVEWSVFQALRVVLRHYGVLGTARKAVARAVRGRASSPPAPPPSAWPAKVEIPAEAYAGIVAVEDVVDVLPRLLEKRRQVQAARRRSDAEVVRIFGAPFHAPSVPPKAREEYERAQSVVVDALGVRPYFELLTPAGDRERTTAPASPVGATRDT